MANDPILFSRSDLLDAWRIPDQDFARAYAFVSDVHRSWIKKNIAQLYALYPPAGIDHAVTRTSRSSGFSSITLSRPRPWACLLLPETPSGPAQVLAALVPVMTSGIEHVLVLLRQSSGWPALLLTGLELCGAETVCAVPAGQNPAILLQALTAQASAGLVLALDGAASADLSTSPDLAQSAFWRPPSVNRIRIWCDASDQWVWSTLIWNHPQTLLEAWGPARNDAPDHVHQIPDSWEDFCKPGALALGVGSHLLHAPELPKSGLILTPGQEGCWFWPDLHPEICIHAGMILTDDRVRSSRW